MQPLPQLAELLAYMPLQWRSGRYEQMLCSLKGIIWSAPYLLLVRQFPAVL